MDVTRGIGWLERKSRMTRAVIGLILIAAGLAMAGAEWARLQ